MNKIFLISLLVLAALIALSNAHPSDYGYGYDKNYGSDYGGHGYVGYAPRYGSGYDKYVYGYYDGHPGDHYGKSYGGHY